jgi:hypothetical protein
MGMVRPTVLMIAGTPVDHRFGAVTWSWTSGVVGVGLVVLRSSSFTFGGYIDALVTSSVVADAVADTRGALGPGRLVRARRRGAGRSLVGGGLLGTGDIARGNSHAV